MSEIIRSLPLPGDHLLELVYGDITLESTDAIVNAANSQLVHGGGVAGAIVRRGGLIIQQESSQWVKLHGPVTRENPAVTSAGDLACKRIIHTVGPVWGEGNEILKLQDALKGVLNTAEILQVQSLSIPPISTGIFGFPVKLAAPVFYQILLEYFKDHPHSVIKKVRITIIDSPTLEVFSSLFPQVE